MTYKDFLQNGGEKKWQDKWLADKIDRAEDFGKQPKKYVLDMFPYPSGAGLHVGHPEGYTATDIYSRYWRMRGYNVLHPMGWDAFGLPAENYAIKTGTHPRVTTEDNIVTFKRQIQSLGFSYDWDREIDTTDPKYYKWTQWIFLQLFKKDLAYEAIVPINFCPSCKTGLANEEVVNGKCDRCETPVIRKDIRQWMLRITAYADRLLTGLDKLDWPESIKIMQENWIGKKYGYMQYYKVDDLDLTLETFTTHHHTSYAEIFLAIAPEHPLSLELVKGTKYEAGASKFIKEVEKKKLSEKFTHETAKDGYFTGRYAKDPFSGRDLPIYIADFALMDFGTGIVKASIHDERDFAFAKAHEITPVEVLFPNKLVKKTETKDKAVYQVIHPGLNAETMADYAYDGPYHEKNIGEVIVEMSGDRIRVSLVLEQNEKLQEESVIRQLLYIYFYENNFNSVVIDNLKGLAIGEKELAAMGFVKKGSLFQIAKGQELVPYSYDGQGYMFRSDQFSGLSVPEARKKIGEWMVEQGYGQKTVTYKLRDWVFSRQRYWGEPIPLVHCEKCGIVPLSEKDLPLTLPEVEKYEPTGTGESPLATIDSWVNTTCPKCGGPAKRETNTMPQWAGSSWYWLRYIDPHNDKELADQKKLKYWLPVDLYLGGAEHAVLHLLYARFWNMVLYDIGVVPSEEPFSKLVNQGLILGEDGEKMSKSRGNVINPDDILKEHGADAFRIYEMFMGPLEAMKPWSTQGMVGIDRFLEKAWSLSDTVGANTSEELEILLNKTIKKVGEDIEKMGFNTAISAMMILLNKFQDDKNISTDTWKKFLLILSPFAPHLAEELWSRLGNKKSIFRQSWPSYDEKKIKDELVEIPVQINGKVRAKLLLPPDISENEAVAAAQADANVAKYLSGQTIKKIIYVKGKLISFAI